jgi:unsaturated rhamnogalacturonyl hydrolase
MWSVMLLIAEGQRLQAAPPEGSAKLGVRFAEMIMARWPDPMTLDPAKHGWEYNSGIVLFGMSKIYQKTGDQRLLNYIRRWVDGYVEGNGNIKWNQEQTHNLDYIQPANLILFLYEQTRDPKYKAAAKTVRDCYDKIPRNAEGGFWHKEIYPNEMWVDGIYMAEPYLVHYARLFGDAAFCRDTAVVQTTLIAKHAFDPKAKLPYHGWDQDRNAQWVNPETGLSPIFWSRGTGWFAMALVDILEYLPKKHPGYASLRELLKNLVEGVKNVQDPKTGLWFQVLDKGGQAGNWIETSGSGMFIYALRKAVRLKYIDARYREVAEKAWKGLQSYVERDDKGMPVITEAVRGMGVQANYDRYVGFERLKNSTHGLMAVQLAASEMEW